MEILSLHSVIESKTEQLQALSTINGKRRRENIFTRPPSYVELDLPANQMFCLYLLLLKIVEYLNYKKKLSDSADQTVIGYKIKRNKCRPKPRTPSRLAVP